MIPNFPSDFWRDLRSEGGRGREEMKGGEKSEKEEAGKDWYKCVNTRENRITWKIRNEYTLSVIMHMPVELAHCKIKTVEIHSSYITHCSIKLLC